CSRYGDVGVVERRHCGSVVNVDLSAFSRIDLIQPDYGGDAGCVALIGIQCRCIVCGVKHGEAAVLGSAGGLRLFVGFAGGALGGADPQHIVIAEGHFVMSAVADGVLARDLTGLRIQNRNESLEKLIRLLQLLSCDIERVAIKNGIGSAAWNRDVALGHQRNALGSGSVVVQRRSCDGNYRDAGGGSSALRSAVEHVSGRAIGREDSLDGIIKAGVGAGAYGKCAEGGKILRLAILGVEIVLGVGGLRRGLLLIGGQSDDAVYAEGVAGGG